MMIRPVKWFDLENLMKTRAELAEFTLSGIVPKDMNEQIAWFSDYLGRGDHHIFVLDDDHGEFIGYSQICDTLPHDFGFEGIVGMTENGYYIRRKFWHHGFGRFLIDRTNEYSFRYIGADLVIIRVLSDNKRAIKIYGQMGFTSVQMLSTVRCGDSVEAEVNLMSLTRKEWEDGKS